MRDRWLRWVRIACAELPGSHLLTHRKRRIRKKAAKRLLSPFDYALWRFVEAERARSQRPILTDADVAMLERIKAAVLGKGAA